GGHAGDADQRPPCRQRHTWAPDPAASPNFCRSAPQILRIVTTRFFDPLVLPRYFSDGMRHGICIFLTGWDRLLSLGPCVLPERRTRARCATLRQTTIPQ